MKNINFELETFVKLFGDQGVQYIREEDAENAAELYQGSELLRTKRVSGYGVPIDETFLEVFSAPEEAARFYNDVRGVVTSGSLLFEPYGIRERMEL